jgi:hypothetical protein
MRRREQREQREEREEKRQWSGIRNHTCHPSSSLARRVSISG